MAEEATQWFAEKLLRDEGADSPFSLLVLNQPLKNSPTLRRLWKNGMNCPRIPHIQFHSISCTAEGSLLAANTLTASLRVAADGGANRLHTISSFHGKFVCAACHFFAR